MAEKRILIADADANVRNEFRDALGEDWIVVGVATAGAALEEAKKQTYNVIVANHDLPELPGVELLNRFRVTYPRTLRFIAAAEDQREKAMGQVMGGHQFLPAPFDRATLKESIERALSTDYGMNNSVRELVGNIRTFPTIPSLYLEVANALKDPNVSTDKIGEIIAKDMAMTTKLVQVLNSAYYGLPRVITDPTEAVGILGFETTKSLIMTVKLLSQYDKVKPVYFSIDSIWKHSTNVARTARVMALLETGDNDCSGVAYTAGLMHDLGKVILAANFDDQYHGAHNVARKQQLQLWEVEKDIFGATHGEIGAYLLSLWGMSEEVVKVAAMHHHPHRSDDKNFSALTAVHVANVLEYEGSPDADGMPVPPLDTQYLEQLGCADRVELWRMARRNPEATASDSRAQRAKSKAKSAAKPAAAAPASEATKSSPVQVSPAPAKFNGAWKWVGVGLGVAAALFFLAQVELSKMGSSLEKPKDSELAKISQPAAKPEPVPAAAPAKPVVVAPVQPTNAVPVPKPDATPTPAPAVAVVKPAPPKTALEKLELQAIFYSADHPSALISGQLASVGEVVAKCRVLEISPSSVTLEYSHQSRTLKLK